MTYFIYLNRDQYGLFATLSVLAFVNTAYMIFCFNLKTSAVESHRMLVEAYSDSALPEIKCSFVGSRILTSATINVNHHIVSGDEKRIYFENFKTKNRRLFQAKHQHHCLD